MSDQILEQYEKGYREGFDDCKTNLIDALEKLRSMTNAQSITIDDAVMAIKQMKYH